MKLSSVSIFSFLQSVGKTGSQMTRDDEKTVIQMQITCVCDEETSLMEFGAISMFFFLKDNGKDVCKEKKAYEMPLQ